MQNILFANPTKFLKIISVGCIVFISFNTFSQDYSRYILNHLSAPEMDGRGYVNKGASRAADFISHQFDSLGLEPISTSYFQSFTLPVNTFPDQMELKVNGRSLKPGIDYLVDPMSGGGSRNDLSLLPINIFKRKQLEKLNKEISTLSNIAVLVEMPDTLSANGKMLFMQTVYLIAEQWPVIISSEEKLTWAVSSKSVSNPVFIIHDLELDKKDKVSFSVDHKLITLKQRNVIAVKKGRKDSGRYLIVCAHYDHLGRMGKDTYFPGANDNASGVAEMLSIAANLRSDTLDHSIVFIAFAGEEAGLKGSTHFVNQALFSIDSIDFVLNLDISGTGDEGITVVNATEFEDKFQMLTHINDSLQLISEIKERGPTANSDHYPFYKRGIPSFFIYTRGGIKAYHDVFDKAETLPFDKAHELVKLYSLFLKELDKQ